MITTRRLPQAITLRWLRRHGACDGWEPTFRELFPDGAPVTLEAALKGYEAGLDVVWVAVRLLRRPEQREFIIFTLRQRQPHIVTLFQRAGLAEHAAKIESIDWTDFKKAEQLLDAAGAAAGAAAWDARAAAWDARDAAWDAAIKEQLEWIAEKLGLKEASR